jgi:hypothetical protein
MGIDVNSARHIQVHMLHRYVLQGPRLWGCLGDLGPATILAWLLATARLGLDLSKKTVNMLKSRLATGRWAMSSVRCELPQLAYRSPWQCAICRLPVYDVRICHQRWHGLCVNVLVLVAQPVSKLSITWQHVAIVLHLSRQQATQIERCVLFVDLIPSKLSQRRRWLTRIQTVAISGWGGTKLTMPINTLSSPTPLTLVTNTCCGTQWLHPCVIRVHNLPPILMSSNTYLDWHDVAVPMHGYKIAHYIQDLGFTFINKLHLAFS